MRRHRAVSFLYNGCMELKNKIKIIFFDVDFTSFDHVHFGVRPLTIYAAKELKKKGYKLCISTSRGFDELEHVNKEFVELMDAVVCLAGAYIKTKDGVITKPIIQKDVNEVINYLDKNNIIYRYATDSGVGYLSHTNSEIDDLFYRYYHMIPSVKKYENESVLQIMYYGADKKVHDELRNISYDLDVINMKYNNEIFSKSVNKGLVIKEVCSILNVDYGLVMAFGDSENDLPLLKNALFGVAMDNGVDSLKKEADYVCEAQDKDGIYRTFIKYGFIEPYTKKYKEVFDDIKYTLSNYSNNRMNDISIIANEFVDTIINKGVVQLFGLNKHEQFVQEIYYRSGGLVPFHKIVNPDINELEKNYKIDPKDSFFLVSDNGNENEIVEIAKYAKKNNRRVGLMVENINNVTSKELFDYIISFNETDKVYKYTLNNTVAELINIMTYSLLKDKGVEPLIFFSNNLENSKEHNEAMLRLYEGRII